MLLQPVVGPAIFWRFPFIGKFRYVALILVFYVEPIEHKQLTPFCWRFVLIRMNSFIKVIIDDMILWRDISSLKVEYESNGAGVNWTVAE